MARWRIVLSALGIGLGLAGPAGAVCPPVPAPVRDVVSNTFYTDPRHSIVDPALMERYRQSVKPVEDFERQLARFASRAQQGKAEWGACAGEWLATWARGEALLGTMSGTGLQAQYVRKWALAAFAMVYLRAGDAIAPADRGVTRAWLVGLARRVDDEYGRRMSERSRNNHYYWLGFALGAAALAGDDEALWRRAGLIYDEALTHIREDGHLPREAGRGVKALHYHNFSVLPLVMLAELAARRGEDWYQKQGGALHRLVRFTLDARRDPAALARLADAVPEALEEKSLGWLPLYARRFAARLGPDRPLADRAFWVNWAGGDMNILARAWTR